MAGASSGVSRLARSGKKLPTRAKAKKILREGKIGGKSITGKQRRFFGHASKR